MRLAATEAMLMMRPQPLSRIDGSTALAHRNGPVRFTSRTRRHAISSRSSTSCVVAMPALLTRMSAGPRAAAVRRTMSCTWLASLTSTARARAWAPLFSRVRAVEVAVASSMSATTTAAPASARARAIPAPIPAPAPVTMATRPDSSPLTGAIAVHLEQRAQAPVKGRRAPGNEARLENLEQLLPRGAEAHGALHVRDQPGLVGSAEGEERDRHELPHLGRHVPALAEAQFVDAVVRLDEVGILAGRQLPFRIDVAARRLHARDQRVRTIVLAHGRPPAARDAGRHSTTGRDRGRA